MKKFKNNQEVLDYIESFYDEKSGYLNADKSIPLESQGNILEKTGQILVALSHIKESDYLINKICFGLIKNCFEGIVPRTVSYLEKEPKERKKGLWEQVERTNLEDGPRKRWYRTDVSHSQMAFLFSGLLAAEKILSGKWLKEIIRFRFNVFGYIKKINTDKPVNNGKFYDWGTVGLKKRLLVGKNHTNLAMKINYQLMKFISKFSWNDNEKFNMLYFLWRISDNTKYFHKMQKISFDVGGLEELDEKAVLFHLIK